MKPLSLLFLFVLLLHAKEAITPIPKEVVFDKQKALLGKALFFDTSLSKDHSVGCISCHNVYDGGADPRVVSRGFGGKKGNVQAPTVLNAVFNFRQFWNGRAKDLYEQAKGPLLNPVEHNMTPESVVEEVKKNKEYVRSFQKIYKNGVTFDNVIDAIVEFEKALVTPDSKFDRYLRGEVKLSQREKEGFELFKRYGCISCHNGINLGGNFFAKIGIFFPYKNERSYPDRYALTKKEIDKNVFKVPTLRNIALTAPYFHDGRYKTLKDAINAMAYYNLGMEMKKDDREKIESFLHTLTGKLPEILDE